MIFKKTRQIFIGLAISMALSCTALPAYALEYNYDGNAPGQTFYHYINRPKLYCQ